MKTLNRLAVLSVVPFLTFAASSASAGDTSALPTIVTGADLVASCGASLAKDMSEQGKLAATSCNHYLAGMVTAVYNATPAGMPTTLSRLGPNKDQTVCFKLPHLLKYDEFARLVVAYEKGHTEFAKRPAIDLAGMTLGDAYPCKS
jgi:hypothetical protein